MRHINKFLWTFVIVGIVSGYGCKKWRDVNVDPNNAADVTVELLLPAAEADIAQVYGGKLQIIGGVWAQYWTQTPNASQYRILEQYQMDASFVSNAWDELYNSALMDLEQIIKKSGNNKNYAAIARILKGYTYQLLADQFNDIPFTEALKGEDGITSPHYDSQEMVYMAIIDMVKEGRDGLDSEAAHPNADDIIFGGDLDLWQRFANTLLLKMYLRLSEKNATFAQQGIAAIEASGIGFLDAGETAQVAYKNEAGNFNPLYSEMNNATITQIQNLIASKTTIDSMNANEDPRIEAFYVPVGASFVALEQGNYSIPNPAGVYSTPSAAVGGDAEDDASAAAPVKLLSAYESLFLQAEAVARGWLTGDDAALFTSAIEANMDEYGADGTDYLANAYWAQYPTGGTVQDKIRHIITQKWFSMCGNQSIESWTEWRRTGFPSFFTISRNSRIGNQFPMRFPYPDSESSNNLNFPGQRPATERVWWDAN
jgi:hypothetical protein